MTEPRRQPELIVGRALAMCVHPYAAWRVQSLGGRALLLFAYTAASYLVVFGALIAGF